MKKKTLIILLLCVAVFLFESCNDTFLSKTNHNSINSSTFFKSASDAKKSINAAYAMLQSHSLWARGIFYLLDAPSDEDSPTVNLTGSPAAMHNHIYSPTNPFIVQAWQAFYDLIGKTNFTIKNVSAMKNLDQTTEVHVLAQAHFLRGLAYFYINSLYGGGPLRTVNNLDKVNIPRTSKDSIWTFVENDFQYAAKNLLKKGQWPSSRKGAATSGAALAMLGKTYLFQNNYTKADSAFQAVMGQHVYHLVKASAFGGDPIAAMYSNFGPDNNNTPESVFQVQFKKGGFIWDGSGIGKGPSQGRSYEYGVKGHAWYNVIPSNSLVNAYKQDDPRLQAFYFGPKSTYLGHPYDFADKGWAWRKYEPTTYEMTGPGNSGINIFILRYAGVLLMDAETKIQEGGQQNIQDGLDLINKIRRRADPSGNILPDRATTSKKTAMKYLRYARRVELSGEQVRYMDLIRWGIADKVLSSFSPKNKLFPIPQEEINRNAAISQDDQNPGY
jgi:hypothetical protein